MKCSGVKGNILMDLHSHCKLSHQIDLSSWVSLSKFDEIIYESFPTLDVYLTIDLVEKYNIRVPGKKIPKWFNHQSKESSILFWVGPEFPTFAFCVAFHLVLLKDSYANNDSYGSVRDDRIDSVCDLRIFINGHKRPFTERAFFHFLKCDHLWFLGMPHSQLQRKYGDLLQVIGIMLRFHVKSLIGLVNSENLLLWLQGWGYMWNAFVLLRIPLSSERTKTTLKMLMTLKTLCSHLFYLLAPLLMGLIWLLPQEHVPF